MITSGWIDARLPEQTCTNRSVRPLIEFLCTNMYVYERKNRKRVVSRNARAANPAALGSIFFLTYRLPQSTLLIIRSFSSRVWSVVRVPAKSCRRHSSSSRITLRNALNLYSSRSCNASNGGTFMFLFVKKWDLNLFFYLISNDLLL